MTQKKIHILVVDDHELVSEAMAVVLSREHDFAVATASSLTEAFVVLEQQQTDIILLDIKLPQMIGVDGVVSVLEHGKGAAVIIFSGTTDEAFARQAIKAGAAGFIPKTMPLRILPAAIRLVRDGGVFMPIVTEAFSAPLNRQNETIKRTAALSDRESTILRFVQAGMTNKEIARKIESTEIRVKMHMRAIFEKLGAKNRAHSVAIAQVEGLISE